jgi:molybdenum cofactor guanylyltransferase
MGHLELSHSSGPTMIHAPDITATILAGGLSRRMFEQARADGNGDLGGAALSDKGLLDLGGCSMIGRVIARVRPQVRDTVINANGDPKRFAALGLPVVSDPIAGFVGPLAGVLAGLRWTIATQPGSTHTLSVSSDAPFLPHDLVARLSEAAHDRPNAIAIARSDNGLHPVIGLWPVALADDLEQALHDGVRKVLAWTDRHGTLPVHFAPIVAGGAQIDPFFNANTPQELDEARRLLALLPP